MKENKPGWVGPYGNITKAQIESYMPPPGDETAMIVMAGTKENNVIRGYLDELGYKHIVPQAR